MPRGRPSSILSRGSYPVLEQRKRSTFEGQPRSHLGGVGRILCGALELRIQSVEVLVGKSGRVEHC